MSNRINRLKTNLIVFDGLPGSGKSTNAQWLTQSLQQQQIPAIFLPEAHATYPLWWYEVWDGKEYRTPDFERIPLQTFMQSSLDKWRKFTSHAQGQLHVIESFFFQNTVGMFLMGDAKPEQLRDYFHELQEIIRSLNPILIYFRQNDTTTALQRICAIRGKGFEQELTRNMESFPYLRQRKLKGLDGVAILWQNIQSITDELYEEYTLRKLKIETSQGAWQTYQREILEFIGLDYSC